MLEYILHKNIIYTQPTDAFRGGLDAVLLAMATPIINNGFVLDVGCGAGAVGLIYAHMTSDTVYIQGIEKSDVFYQYAQNNVCANGWQNRMYIQQSDIVDLIPTAQEKYDLIMTNPPYDQSHTGTPSKNPLKHIAHTETTVNLCQWIHFCLQSVKTRGIITMIHKTDRLPHILHCVSDKKVGIKIRPIITKHGEKSSRILVHICKGINTPFILHPPITIYKNGIYTETAKKNPKG